MCILTLTFFLSLALFPIASAENTILFFGESRTYEKNLDFFIPRISGFLNNNRRAWRSNWRNWYWRGLKWSAEPLPGRSGKKLP